jgi:ankyrin repeat protein
MCRRQLRLNANSTTRVVDKTPDLRMTGSFFGRRLCAVLLLAGLAAAAPAQTMTNPWLEALAKRDLVALSRLLESGPVNPNLALPDGRTALMLAARKADAELAVQLIRAGANVNASNVNGGTVLMFASIAGDAGIVGVKGHTEVARVLLDFGANQGTRDAYGWTALMRAAGNGRIGVVRLLLGAAGADLALTQEAGATVLHIAAASGDPDIVELLLARGADVAARDGNGNTAADMAMASGHFELAEHLRSLETLADQG